MAEYIEREAFLKSKREQYCENCNRRKNSKGKMVYDIGDAPCRACSIDDILCDVEDFPVADVVERKHGKWVNPRPDSEMCSSCGVRFSISSLFAVGGNEEPNFCPNCGADKREKEGE